MKLIHGNSENDARAAIQKPAAVVIAIKKIISGLVSSQKSDNVLDPEQLRRTTAGFRAARTGSLASVRLLPGYADRFAMLARCADPAASAFFPANHSPALTAAL